MASLLEWMRDHPVLMTGLAVLSLLMFVTGLVIAPLILTRMPADYFLDPRPRPESWRAQHPVVRWLLRVLKNVLGIVLILAGIAMLVLPGQGILTILVGVLLLDGPGKRRLEIALVRLGPVHRGINWLREKAGKPPLIVPAQ